MDSKFYGIHSCELVCSQERRRVQRQGHSGVENRTHGAIQRHWVEGLLGVVIWGDQMQICHLTKALQTRQVIRGLGNAEAGGLRVHGQAYPHSEILLEE